MAPPEKRRRKKTRTAAFSSDSDSDSDSSNQSALSANKPDDSASEPSELSEGALSDSEPEAATQLDPTQVSRAEAETARELLHKAPSQSDEEFNQFYMNLVTEQFSNDLVKLRQANDFGPGSIDLLIAGLKQGANIFDDEQKRILLNQKD